MTSQPSAHVTFALTALGWALDRLESIDPSRDPDGAAAATGEALVWVFSLWGYTVGKAPQENPLRGMVYVRDRVAHQCANTIDVVAVRMGAFGTRGPFGSARQFGVSRSTSTLRWKERDDMPPPGKRHDCAWKRDAYDEQLAGRSVPHVLRAAEHKLREAVEGAGPMGPG